MMASLLRRCGQRGGSDEGGATKCAFSCRACCRYIERHSPTHSADGGPTIAERNAAGFSLPVSALAARQQQPLISAGEQPTPLGDQVADGEPAYALPAFGADDMAAAGTFKGTPEELLSGERSVWSAPSLIQTSDQRVA